MDTGMSAPGTRTSSASTATIIDRKDLAVENLLASALAIITSMSPQRSTTDSTIRYSINAVI